LPADALLPVKSLTVLVDGSTTNRSVLGNNE